MLSIRSLSYHSVLPSQLADLLADRRAFLDDVILGNCLKKHGEELAHLIK